MGKLTLQSTFKDIRDLLENKDELFCKQCEYLCGDKFKNETDKGYLIQNFHFFMAIGLLPIEKLSFFTFYKLKSANAV